MNNVELKQQVIKGCCQHESIYIKFKTVKDRLYCFKDGYM